MILMRYLTAPSAEIEVDNSKNIFDVWDIPNNDWKRHRDKLIKYLIEKRGKSPEVAQIWASSLALECSNNNRICRERANQVHHDMPIYLGG